MTSERDSASAQGVDPGTRLPPDGVGLPHAQPGTFKASGLRRASRYLAAVVIANLLAFGLTLGLPDASLQLTGGLGTSRAVQQLREEFHLDRSPVTRLALFWRDLATGRLHSFYTREPLLGSIGAKANASSAVLGTATMMTLIIAMLCVVTLRAAHTSGRILRMAVGAVAAVPTFLVATALLVAGAGASIPLWALAGLALASFPGILMGTQVHSRLEAAQRQPYSVLAIVYRLPRAARLRRTLLELAIVPVLLLNAVVFFLTSGLAIVEPILGIAGLGRWFLESLLRLDLPVVYLVVSLVALGAGAVSLLGERLFPIGASATEAGA